MSRAGASYAIFGRPRRLERLQSRNNQCWVVTSGECFFFSTHFFALRTPHRVSSPRHTHTHSHGIAQTHTRNRGRLRTRHISTLPRVRRWRSRRTSSKCLCNFWRFRDGPRVGVCRKYSCCRRRCTGDRQILRSRRERRAKNQHAGDRPDNNIVLSLINHHNVV